MISELHNSVNQHGSIQVSIESISKKNDIFMVFLIYTEDKKYTRVST